MLRMSLTAQQANRRRGLALMLLGLAALLAVASACGGPAEPGSGQFPKVIPLGDCQVCPIIVNSSLAVGDSRFSLGLLDEEENPILGARVHLRFFDLNGPEPILKAEGAASFIAMELFFIDEQAGKQKRFVGENGVYVTQVHFDVPGRWGVEITPTLDGQKLETVRFQFNVLEKSREPAIGEPAPPSRQLTLADVADIAEIDSSFPPRPHMHDITIADALATGKPIVVAFATPAFCESRTCGPVMDTVMDPLYEKYQSQAVFIHVEPYQLKELREGIALIPVQAMQEWRLETEPWLFVIDKQGRIAGKFEGITGLDEVERVLQQVLAEG